MKLIYYLINYANAVSYVPHSTLIEKTDAISYSKEIDTIEKVLWILLMIILIYPLHEVTGIEKIDKVRTRTLVLSSIIGITAIAIHLFRS